MQKIVAIYFPLDCTTWMGPLLEDIQSTGVSTRAEIIVYQLVAEEIAVSQLAKDIPSNDCTGK